MAKKSENNKKVTNEGAKNVQDNKVENPVNNTQTGTGAPSDNKANEGDKKVDDNANKPNEGDNKPNDAGKPNEGDNKANDNANKPSDNKDDDKKVRHVEGYPSWVMRPVQDVNTYNVIKQAQELGYRSNKLEANRTTRGFITVAYRADKLWEIQLTFVEAFEKDEKNKAEVDKIKAEFDKWYNADTTAIKENLSGISSERRQASSVAKLLSAKFKLAYSESKDIQSVSTKELSSTERRQAIYKKADKATSEPQAEQAPTNEPANEDKQKEGSNEGSSNENKPNDETQTA